MFHLERFIETGRKAVINHRAHVRHPDFSSFYLRFSKLRRIPIGCGSYTNVLDIASVDARNPGNGSFKRLIQYIREKHPDIHIFVESVLTKQFHEGLKRMGFIEVPSTIDWHIVRDFFLEAAKPEQPPSGTLELLGRRKREQAT